MKFLVLYQAIIKSTVFYNKAIFFKTLTLKRKTEVEASVFFLLYKNVILFRIV